MWVRSSSHALVVNRQIREELLYTQTHTDSVCRDIHNSILYRHVYFLHQKAAIPVQGTVCMHNSSEH